MPEIGVCLNSFISQTDKGYAESPARRGPTSEPPILVFAQTENTGVVNATGLARTRIKKFKILTFLFAALELRNKKQWPRKPPLYFSKQARF